MDSTLFIVQKVDRYSVVELRTPSLMDPIQLNELETSLCRLIDEEDRRLIILDFERVEYISSQFIGTVIAMHKKLGALKHSRLVLCSVGPKLMELLRIMRLDKKLNIVATQEEALRVPPT